MSKDWKCPYCPKILYGSENKLRHLGKHEPCIERLAMDNFRMSMLLVEHELKEE